MRAAVAIAAIFVSLAVVGPAYAATVSTSPDGSSVTVTMDQTASDTVNVTGFATGPNGLQDIRISPVDTTSPPAGCQAVTPPAKNTLDCPVATSLHVTDGSSSTVDLNNMQLGSVAVANGAGSDQLTAAGTLTSPLTYTAGGADTGSDTIDLSGVTGSMGALTVTMAGGNNDLKLPTTQGAFTVDMGSGTGNTLDFSSDSDGNGASFTFSGTSVGTGANTTFKDVETLKGTGNGPDSFDVSSASGGDTVIGGGGANTLTFAEASSGVSVNLFSGRAVTPSTPSGYLTFAGFQDIVGSSQGGNTFIQDGGSGTIDGNSSANNTVDYSGSPTGVKVDLSAGTETSGANQQDTLKNIQNVIGSAAGGNLLIAGSGNETLDGGGGAGNTVSFAGVEQPGGSGTTVDLQACAAGGCSTGPTGGPGTAATPGGGTVTFKNIQDIQGGPAGDTVQMPASAVFNGLSLDSTATNTLDFSADQNGTTFSFDQTDPRKVSLSSPNVSYDHVDAVIGTAGDDTFDAENFHGQSAANSLNGGGGTNTLSYASYDSNHDVSVDLGNGQATTPNGTYAITKFQNAIGGAGPDTLTGGNQNDMLVGGAGDNKLYPGTGTNTVIGGPGNNTVSYEKRNGAMTIDLTGHPDSGTSGHDLIMDVQNAIAGSGDTKLIGTAATKALTGGQGNDTFIPGPGSVTIDGGGGTNTVSYADRPVDDPVTVDLAAGAETDGTQQDTLSGIQSAVGGSGDDTLIAGPGNETLTSGPGDSTLIGGPGNDTLNTGTGNDYVEVGSGAATVNTGGGSSVIWTRNGQANTVNCASGSDTVYAQPGDTVTGCKTVVIPPPILAGAAGPGQLPPAGPPPLLPISAKVHARFKRVRKGRTRVTQLEVLTAGANTSIVSSCHGSRRACPFREEVKVLTTQTASYDLRGLFGDVPVRPGTRLELALLQPNLMGRVYTYVFQRHGQPKLTVQCEAIGKAPTAC